MKLCDEHFQKLILALIERGLGKFLPDDPEDARQRWREIRQIEFNKETYEPIYFCCFALITNASRMGGVVTAEEHSSCPVCADPAQREEWIDFVVQDAYNEALRLGFTVEELEAAIKATQ